MVTKGFQTLQGALAGAEPEDFTPTSSFQAILRIVGRDDALDFDSIETNLKLTPTSTRRRGQKSGLRGPPSKQDRWMFQAPVAEDRELYRHIDALWEKLKPHVDYLHALKRTAHVDIYLGYSSNIDHAGLTIPYKSLEIFRALELDVGLSIIVVVD